MNKKSKATDRRGLWLSLLTLGLVAGLVIVPNYFRSEAVKGKGGFVRTASHEEGFDNFDVRTAKSEDTANFIAAARSANGLSADRVANIKKNFEIGEAKLRNSVPTLSVDYDSESGNPEVLTPNVNTAGAYLSARTGNKNADTLRNFIDENNDLIGVDDSQSARLKVTADYTNPDGNLSFATMEQFVDNIPVFRGEIKAGFDKNGRMFRVVNDLAPGLNYEGLSRDFGDPANSVRAAFTNVSRAITANDLAPNLSVSSDIKVVFGEGDWATTAEKMYFPTEPGVAVPAWRVLIWQPVQAYYVIVDAQSGKMLWRKNLTNDQSQSATYQVYTAPSWLGVAANPAPLTPGPIDPTLNTQGTNIARTNVTLIGNEAPNLGQNNNGWITDGANITDGNNVQAGLDRDGVNGVDAPQTGSPNRVFDSTWNPPPGNPSPGDEPLTAQAQRGSVIQMFYVMNKYHDALYSLGFNEQARNYQDNNFGRGGTGGDRITAEGQDSNGTNNANFSIAAEGVRGRMQMYLWTGPTPDRDGTTDAEIIIHEVTHGTSQRLHNNSAGLTTNMSSGMGEGWGDFYAHTMLSRPTEPLNSTNATGGYVTLNLAGVASTNYYYGIRRFPKARMAFVGGPNNRPHNPLTFADVDSTQAAQADGAYPAVPGGHVPPSQSWDQVHAMGEIWSSALWEVRCLFVARLGFDEGNRRVLQFVTDGMKLDPTGPTFLQARNSIIQAAINANLSGQDVADIREGFRIRGMGFSATIQNAGTGGNSTRVTEAFDLPNAVIANPIAFTDPTPGGNGNTYADPGETIQFSVPVTNTTGATMTNVVVSANGGPAVSYGSVANAATVVKTIPVTIPAGQACGSNYVVSFVLTSDAGTQVPFTKTISIGQPIIGFTENFDGVVAPLLPTGWTTAVTGAGVASTTTAVNPSSAPNAVLIPEAALTSTSELVTPGILVTSASARLSFKNSYNMESGFDGMVLEISNPSVNGGAYQDIITAGGSFVSGGYNGPVTQSGTCVAPLTGRQTWTGLSGGTTAVPAYLDAVVNLPASANGQTIKLKFLVGNDCSAVATGVPGVRVDNVTVTNGATCSVVNPSANSDVRADFDNDGKSDLSVFRSSTGVWYVNGSTSGFTANVWGISTDVPVPGDYDGDDKADLAIFRASNVVGAADFYVLKSSTGTVTGVEFGLVGDLPIVGDFNGDDVDDYAVYRPSTGYQYSMTSVGQVVAITSVGVGVTPVAGDFDGDDKTDIADVSATNVWTVRNSGGGVTSIVWGVTGDKPVPADYDGDGKEDIATFRPSNGNWYIHGSAGVDTVVHWGSNGDIAVPGDYDGDGKDDVAIYRAGTWYINRSTAGVQITPFGLGTDTPIASKYQQ